MIYLKFIENFIKLTKKNIFLILIISLLFAFSSSALTNKDLTSKQLLCPTLLWGFEFISHNRVKVIDTDLNKKTKITEYYYDTDLDLSYINIFFDKNNLRDRVYSIELNTLRVDIWTMTGGGFTTREMFPKGLCEFVKTNNIYSHIESLKQNS
tara:strand:- start:847 stop:1305 length:459 start_codon:yes stop_codon:yes gene_type:complete